MNALRTAAAGALIAVLLPLAGAPQTGTAGTTIPFAFVDHRIALSVRVDGAGTYTMVLDTGASATLAADDARALHLRLGRGYELGGTGPGRVRAYETRVGALDLGAGIVLRDVPTAVVTLEDLRRVTALPRFDGLIGSELLARYVVRIDYARQELTLEAPGEYAPDPDGVTLNLLRRQGTPAVRAGVDGSDGSFVIDTGDRVPLTLMEPYAKAHRVLERYPSDVQGLTGWGFGGPVSGIFTRVGELKLGAFAIEEPLTRIPTVSGGFFTSRRLAGSIGTGICEQFTVTFDVPQGTVTFAQRHDPEAAYDRSGLFLGKSTSALAVVSVLQGSPAQRSGFLPGDRIIAVDGRPVDDGDALAYVRAVLAGSPGTALRVSIERGEVTRELGLVLEDLV